MRNTQRPSRGTVILIVLWAIAIAAMVTTAVQLTSFRQAAVGRDAMQRIEARWAARAGVEQIIAVMASHTERPEPEDAFAMVRDMEYVAVGDLLGASYDIRHHVDGRDIYGPMDEHSKMNVNSANIATLMLLEDMWLDIADAIVAWISEDDDASAFSVGRDYYLSLNPPYEPRNGPVQSIAELELVAGVWPRHLRGEDWNLNARLDRNENNAGVTFPQDNGDGILDAGWSASLTATSVQGGATGSGQPRLYLAKAKIAEVQERLGVDERQAKALIRFGRNEQSAMEQLLVHPISHIDAQGAVTPQEYNPELEPLTEEQYRAVFRELTVIPPHVRLPGKLNINTVPATLLRDLLELYGVDFIVAEEIIYLRDTRPEGITSMLDLRSIPEITDDLMEQLGTLFDTHSNVYTISSIGRSWGIGVEVEIVAVVDRSTVPVRILEYREQ
jgi:hypothetical protein